MKNSKQTPSKQKKLERKIPKALSRSQADQGKTTSPEEEEDECASCTSEMSELDGQQSALVEALLKRLGAATPGPPRHQLEQDLEMLRGLRKKGEIKSDEELATHIKNTITRYTTGGTVQDDTGAKHMAKVFKDQNHETANPWMGERNTCVKQMQQFMEAFDADPAKARKSLVGKFEHMIADGLLQPMEVISIGYNLCPLDGNYERSAFLFAALLISGTAEKQLSLHNWHMAEFMPEAERNAVGEAIARCTMPMIPGSTPELQYLNSKLMNLASAATGGAPQGRRNKLALTRVTVQGAGYQAPCIDHAGIHVANVDLAPVEQAFDASQQEARRLDTEVRRLQAEFKTVQRQLDTIKKQRDQPPPYRQHGPHPAPERGAGQRGGYNTQQRQPAGYSQGRGRGGGGRAWGGDAAHEPHQDF
jgi:hypothetical protein